VLDVIDRVPRLKMFGAYAEQFLRDRLIEHRQYITEHGDDPADIRDWHWSRTPPDGVASFASPLGRVAL